MKTAKSKTKPVGFTIKDLAKRADLEEFEKSMELIKKYPVKKFLVKEVPPVWQICR